MQDYGTWVKIERAKEHILNLGPEVSAFLHRNPYATFGEDDPKTGDRVIRVHVIEEPPLRLGAIAADGIHNMRACLDFLAWRLVLANGRTPNSRTKFPVSGNAKDFESRDLPKIEGASQTAIDLIRSFRPYKSGNDVLYALHRLDLMQKHRDLIPVGAALDRHKLEISGLGTLEGYGSPTGHPTYPLKDGVEIMRITPAFRSQMHYDPQFTFSVTLGETEVLKGQPLVEALHEMLDTVEYLVSRASVLLP